MIANAKIKPAHLERSAYVYVRQSTDYQVQNNLESQQRQYELAKLAVRYGWAEERVVLIDDDLGRSGSSAAGRVGFARLVADVALSKAGIVFGLEVSRLARNNRDWYQLLDLCSITLTLIGDADGVYDPSSFNDRLLLGLKGTMSEAELHVLKGRMLAGMQHKASKGELRFSLPPGYEFEEHGRIVKAHDEQVVHIMSLVFAKFFEIGTVSGVLKYLLEEGLAVPRKAAFEQKVRWVRPFYRAVYKILTNPLYAGAYVFGRSRVVKMLDAGGHASSRRKELPLREWGVVIRDHHPAYISWDQFLRLRVMIANNAPAAPGETGKVAREGPALLQGLARCGQCGRAMRVSYHGGRGVPYANYVCRGAKDYGGTFCQVVGGSRIDEAVAAHFLEEMAPASAAVHLAALNRSRAQHDEVLAQLQLELERAQYEADRKARQFHQVEPENRLVARTLEAEWNQALARVDEVRQRVAARDELRSLSLTHAEEEEIKRLAHDLPALWQARSTIDKDRKFLLRAVLEEVQIRKDGREVFLKILWKGGAVVQRSAHLPKLPTWNATPVDVVNLVRELATRHTDEQIARILIRKRVKSARDGRAFNAHRVACLRLNHGIECYRKSNDRGVPTYTVNEGAKILEVGPQTVYHWLRHGMLKGDQLTASAPWAVCITDEDRRRLTAADAPEGWLPLRQAASRLGVSRQAIVNWVKERRINYVYVTKGRRRGLRIDVASATCGAQERLFPQTVSTKR
jgi:DNA invertase Pin-like site-specific DNA recombinase